MICIDEITNVDRIENKVIIRPVGTVDIYQGDSINSIDPLFYYKLGEFISFGRDVGDLYVMKLNGDHIYRVHNDEFKNKYDVKTWFYDQVNKKGFDYLR